MTFALTVFFHAHTHALAGKENSSTYEDGFPLVRVTSTTSSLLTWLIGGKPYNSEGGATIRSLDLELCLEEAAALGLTPATHDALFNKGTVKNQRTLKRNVRCMALRDRGLWKDGEAQSSPAREWVFASTLPQLQLREASAAEYAAKVAAEKARSAARSGGSSGGAAGGSGSSSAAGGGGGGR